MRERVTSESSGAAATSQAATTVLQRVESENQRALHPWSVVTGLLYHFLVKLFTFVHDVLHKQGATFSVLVQDERSK